MPARILTNTLTRVFGSRNHQILKELGQIVSVINSLETKFERFSDDNLFHQTSLFKERLAGGESLDSLLAESFAVVREASKRKLGMRPFDVQLLGGLVLTRKSVAEMKTGEGKSLTSTLPAYWRSLSGKGVHVVTVNEYLAHRDSQINAELFSALDVTVGMTKSEQDSASKKAAYKADITYGTSNQFGFDYLYDNSSVANLDDRVQRGHYCVILDEVDSILIDESKTPLVLSQSHCGDNENNLYSVVYPIVTKLTTQDKMDDENYEGDGDVFVDLKMGKVNLTERGFDKLETELINNGILKENASSLYIDDNAYLMYVIQACLSAHFLFHKDNQYIVRDNQVYIIDPNTGRVSSGKRWVRGIHEAIEVKENLDVKAEASTSASISNQNYFRIYENISGMTGTADTEAFEFVQIYGMETVVVPTNRPMIRQDLDSILTIDLQSKLDIIIADIQEKIEQGRPVLVGTRSIESSELISKSLSSIGIKHKVLNAKYHEKEAEIIAQAGVAGRVTIATNMAGRGTDIILGGNFRELLTDDISEESRNEIIKNWEKENDNVVKAGGLHVIGTEHLDSRRIDNQLRGRSGRQGDPGSSRFYASLEDELFKKVYRIDYLEKMKKNFQWIIDIAGELPAKLIIEKAQQAVESQSFDARKNVLEYDDVVNEYRVSVYKCRNLIIEADDVTEAWNDLKEKVFKTWIEKWAKENKSIFNTPSFYSSFVFSFVSDFGFELDIEEISNIKIFNLFINRALELVLFKIRELESAMDNHRLNMMIKQIFINTLDEIWCEHLELLDQLKNNVRLVSFAQQDPKLEHKKQSFIMFKHFFKQLEETTVHKISTYISKYTQHRINHEDNPIVINKFATYLRNQSCPCGSGLRFKECHGSVVVK